MLQFLKDFISNGFGTLIIIGLNFELCHKGVEPLDGGWVVLNRCKNSLIKFEMMIYDDVS